MALLMFRKTHDALALEWQAQIKDLMETFQIERSDLEWELSDAKKRAKVAQKRSERYREQLDQQAATFAEQFEMQRLQHKDQLDAMQRIVDRIVDTLGEKGPSSLIIREPENERPDDAIGTHEEMMDRHQEIWGDGLSVEEMEARVQARRKAIIQDWRSQLEPASDE